MEAVKPKSKIKTKHKKTSNIPLVSDNAGNKSCSSNELIVESEAQKENYETLAITDITIKKTTIKDCESSQDSELLKNDAEKINVAFKSESRQDLQLSNDETEDVQDCIQVLENSKHESGTNSKWNQMALDPMGSFCQAISKESETSNLIQIIENTVSNEPTCPEQCDMPESIVQPLQINNKSRTEEVIGEINLTQTSCQYPTLKQEEIENLDEIKPFTREQILSMYRNAELEINHEFIDYFILNQKEPQNSEFYELLKCYLRARQNLLLSEKRKLEVEQNVFCQAEDIWNMVPQTISNKGPCSDGTILTATHDFFQSQLNEAAFFLLKHSLQEEKDHIQNNYALHIYTSEVVRLQIEYFIYRLLNSSTFKNIPFNAPVSAFNQHEIFENEKDEINTLRQCISDLFNFQRKLVKDIQFLNDTRNWLTRLIAVLLRKATLSDHLFILNHVLRCPAGISQWAVSFIQPPSPFSWSVNLSDLPAFGSSLLDHVVTTLATIMLPIKARENFLLSMKSIQGGNSASDPSANIWVVVFDSEGEEDEDPETSWLQWQENDIVSLLNQVPIAEMFRHILYITKRGEADSYDVTKSNEQSILKLISFATHLILLFNEGFKTFNSLRFRQLTKRVSRLIRHTVQYVSDHWECFKENSLNLQLEPHEKAMLLRLQVEYDQYFLRATKVIFSSKKLGSWQFMAVLPYKSVSTQMMWGILWLLHNSNEDSLKEVPYQEYSWNKQLKDSIYKKRFLDMLGTLGDSEAYYLLTSFSNMAIARDAKDAEIVNWISLEIFEIAFLHERLRETLSREGRDLLASICVKHPCVISVLLRNSVECIEEVGMMALFLFRELPLHLWKPTDEDFEILSHCLLHNALTTPLNQLSKLILTGLNWGFDSMKKNLYLHPNFQRKVAFLLVKACEQFAYEDGYLIYRSVQQVLFLAQSLRDNAVSATTPQGFAAWAWDILLSLHLHSLDYVSPSWSQVLEGNVESCAMFLGDIQVPKLEQDGYLQPLMKGLEDKKPVANFVALMMTNVGHSRSAITDRGLPLWSDLISKGVYYASAHALYFLLPFYYSQPEKIVENEKFIQDLQIIILADLTYTSVAKSLVVQEFPGKTLKFLAGTMLSQIKLAKEYTVEVGGQALKLWCLLLLKILELGQKGLLAKWKGVNHVFYLLDKLMETALTDAYLMDTLTITLSRLVKDWPLEDISENLPTSNAGVVSSLFSIMTWSGQASELPSLIANNTLPSFPWLFWFILSAETAHSQMELLWQTTLRELSIDFQLTTDAALKKSSAKLKLACPKLETLPIYRFARNSLETSTDHPSLPLLWQKFFTLYLQRSDNQGGNSLRGSVGFKFFDGDYYLPLVKKMKKRLIDSADKYFELCQNASQALDKLLIENSDEELNETEKERLATSKQKEKMFYSKLTQIFRAFSLWIGEPRLHDANLNLSAFPPQYCSDRLKDVIQPKQCPWMDLLDMEVINKDICDIEKYWYAQRRVIMVSPRYGHKEETPSGKRILQRLQTYEEPLAPPQLQTLQAVTLEATSDILNSKTLFLESVQSGCRTICEQACHYSDRLSKHLALDIEYLSLIPQLYININSQKVKNTYCHRRQLEGCAGPAPICIKFKEAHKSTAVDNCINANRIHYGQVISESTQPPPRNVCCAVVYVENCVTALVKSYRQHGIERAASKNRLREMGLDLFHHIMSLVGESTNSYAPTRQFLSSSLEVLGQEFVYGQEDQCMPLIKAVISRPWLAGLVAPLFTPSKASAETYIQLYQYLVSNLTPASGHSVFVLLSKFDLIGWLKSSSSTVFERVTLLESIEKALTIFGNDPDEALLIVFGVYRNHLQFILSHRFPELYLHVVKLMLKGTRGHWLNIEIWNDFLKSLGAHSQPSPSKEPEVLGHWFAAYGTSTFIFSEEQLEESIEILTTFYRELSKASVPCRDLNYYLEKLALFTGLLCHSYTYTVLHNVNTSSQPNSSALEQKANVIWEKLKLLFQYLTESNNSMRIDAHDLNTMFLVFTNCLCFLHTSLTDELRLNLLSKIWNYYCETFCDELVKDSDRFFCHTCLLSIPWDSFLPNLDDINSMKDAVDKDLADCSAFIGTVFLQIPWCKSFDLAIKLTSAQEVKDYCFCWALVATKISWEPNVKRTQGMIQLLEIMEPQAPWHVIDTSNLKRILGNVSILSVPTSFILQKPDDPETYVIKFIRHLCDLSPPPSYSETSVLREWKTPFVIDENKRSEKRNLYVSFHIRQLIRAVPRNSDANRSFLIAQVDNFKLQLCFLLNTCEAAIATEKPSNQFTSATTLMIEFLGVLGISSPPPFQELALKELVTWWKKYPGSVLLRPCVLAACKTLPYVRHLVILVESCFSVFCSTVSDTTTPYGCWSHIIPTLEVPISRQDEFLSACVDNGAHFCQTAYLMRILPTCQSLSEELGFLQSAFEWTCKVKADEESEAKILLIWDKIFELSLRQLDFGGDAKATERVLSNLCTTLLTFGEDKVSGGILGAIGLGKKSPFSIRMRFMCRTLATFVTVQIPTNGNVRLSPNAPGHFQTLQEGRGRPSQQAQQAVGRLENLKGNKQYSSLVDATEYVWKFIMNPGYSLRDGQSLVKELANLFFPNVKYLCILNLKQILTNN